MKPTGELIISHIYDTVSLFLNNRAITHLNEHIIVIDSTGNEVFRKTDYNTIQDFKFDYTTFHKSRSAGIIDLLGNELGTFRYVEIIDNQWAKVLHETNGNWALFNLETHETLKASYDYITPILIQGKRAFLVARDRKLGFVNSEGREIHPPKFRVIESQNSEWPIPFQEGIGTPIGYLNYDGSIAIPTDYEHGLTFSEGLASVQKNGKYGFINPRNEVVIPFEYDFGYWFSEGLAIVNMEGKSGVINKKNEVVIPFKFEEQRTDMHSSIFIHKRVFKQFQFENGRITLEQNQKDLIVRSNGEVLNLPFDYERVFEIGNSLYVIANYDYSEYQLINTKIGFQSKKYDRVSIGFFTQDYISFDEEGLIGLMKPDGTVVIKPQWSEIEFVTPNLIFAENYWSDSPYDYQFYDSNASKIENCK